MMKSIVVLFALLAVAHVASARYARADFYALDATETGITHSTDNYAVFTQLDLLAIQIEIHITGIVNRPDDLHGIHIHTYGDLSNAAALGGHWDPHGMPHGCPPDTARHAGDLGNWQATGGEIHETKVFDLLDMAGPYSIIGRSIVLHNGTDDCVNVPASGARLAAGVIGVLDVYDNQANAGHVTAPTLAVCNLMQTDSGAANGQSGTFAFMQSGAGAPVIAVGSLARTGVYGVHVHSFGDLNDRATGTGTGAHFDPFATEVHALPDSAADHHAGDMGNTAADQVFTGRQWFYGSFDYMDIIQGANNESIIGRGFIVHQDADDGTGVNGNAGLRNAQCVIGYADATLTSVPTIYPGAEPGTDVAEPGTDVAPDTVTGDPAAPTSPTAPAAPTSNTPSGDSSSLLASTLFVIAAISISALLL